MFSFFVFHFPFSVNLAFAHIRRTFLFLYDGTFMSQFLWFIRGTICLIKLNFFPYIMVVVFLFTDAMICFRFQLSEFRTSSKGWNVRAFICP